MPSLLWSRAIVHVLPLAIRILKKICQAINHILQAALVESSRLIISRSHIIATTIKVGCQWRGSTLGSNWNVSSLINGSLKFGIGIKFLVNMFEHRKSRACDVTYACLRVIIQREPGTNWSNFLPTGTLTHKVYKHMFTYGCTCIQKACTYIHVYTCMYIYIYVCQYISRHPMLSYEIIPCLTDSETIFPTNWIGIT